MSKLILRFMEISNDIAYKTDNLIFWSIVALIVSIVGLKIIL